MGTIYAAIGKRMEHGILLDDLRRGVVKYLGPSRNAAEASLLAGMAGEVVESDDGETWYLTTSEPCIGRTYEMRRGPLAFRWKVVAE